MSDAVTEAHLPARALVMLVVLLTSLALPSASGAVQDEEPQGAGLDQWSEAYRNHIFPWAPAGDLKAQFKEYSEHSDVVTRMQMLAEDHSDIFEFHEGLNGGVNARDETTTGDTYEGWYHGYGSPWMKVTADVSGGAVNPFNGDSGNYADRPDVMIVGNHHAREWMSVHVPLMMLEVIAFSYDNIGYDNDGDGRVDEDPWGDADGDGILDDDGDCLALSPDLQDSNGDGTPCNPGDLGVDEDYSEQLITDLVNSREMYIIPLLNVDGYKYDHEVWVGANCAGDAWGDDCARSGWRKNLRDNTVTGVTPLPDLDEDVDPSCDGVDLNRNYQYEWGAPLGATGPLFPGMCYAGEAGPNNDVYNGPFDTNDDDGDGVVNEDHVDGNDDDNDGLIDEDPMGGNTEPETKFIQDMTEMNDDDGDGESDFKTTLTHHSFSELVLYPWGHCTNCETPDHAQLVYHGDVMAEYTDYTNMQSSGLYPTTGDFCDWHYGVHGSYCYTMEIGTAFHQHPDDIDHIAVRNLGVNFYMALIADAPRERANLAIANISQSQFLTEASDIVIPETGDIPVDMCLALDFPLTLDANVTHLMYRYVKPSRLQSDYGPREWAVEADWSMVAFEETNEGCELRDGRNGTVYRSMLPIDDASVGQVHYKAMIGTLSGAFPFSYPANGGYEVLSVPYRAPFGSGAVAFFMFMIIASLVWGGLAWSLREMLSEGEPPFYEEDPDAVVKMIERATDRLATLAPGVSTPTPVDEDVMAVVADSDPDLE